MSIGGPGRFNKGLYGKIPTEYSGKEDIIDKDNTPVIIEVVENGKSLYYWCSHLIPSETYDANRAQEFPKWKAEIKKEELQKEHPSAKIYLLNCHKK